MKRMCLILIGVVGVSILFSSSGDCRPSLIERKALRAAKGNYKGFFRGTVGNSYNEAATCGLKLKYGKGRSKVLLDIPGDHIVSFVKVVCLMFSINISSGKNMISQY